MQTALSDRSAGTEAGLPRTKAVHQCARRRDMLGLPLLACLPLPMLLQGCQSTPGTTAAETAPPSPWNELQGRGLQELGFVKSGQEWELSLATSLLFDFDSDRLQSGQRARLSQLGRQLRDLGVPSLRIEGHSDTVGGAVYNQQLSLRRASAVSQVLQGAGWPAGALKTQGFGRDKPIADNTTEAGRSKNRRVVLIAMAV
jgi:outer membrane protein OmpA-like peptidoglycan-associated protein